VARNIAENLNRLSRAHEREFKLAKNEQCFTKPPDSINQS